MKTLLSPLLIPPSSAGRRLALIALIDSLGMGMFLTGASLYFTRTVGLRPEEVGLGLSIARAVGLLGTVPIGMLADRFGLLRVYVFLQVWRGFGYLAYSLVSLFPAFLAVAAAVGVADCALPAIDQAVVGSMVTGEERVETLAKIRALWNVGFGLGALLATGVILVGTRTAFLALVLGNGLACFIAALLLSRLHLVHNATTIATSFRQRLDLSHDFRYMSVALLNGFLSVDMTLLTIGLPLWIAGYTRIPVAVVGVLVTINTIMVATLQARFAASAGTVWGALRCARWSGLALATCGLVASVMGKVTSVWVGTLLAVVAVVMMTCGELWQVASGWTLSFELARTEHRTRSLATFQLGASLQSVIGPWMIVRLVFPSQYGWIGFATVMALTGVLMGIVVARQPLASPALGAGPQPFTSNSMRRRTSLR